MLAEPKLRLELTGMEVFYLEGRIKNTDISEGLPDKDAYVPQGRDLALLVGGLFNELITANSIVEGPLPIYITKEQAWSLRSKVVSTDMGYDNKTNVGIPLLHKIYDVLLQFDSDLGGIEVASVPYDDLVMTEELVEKFKDRYNAS